LVEFVLPSLPRSILPDLKMIDIVLCSSETSFNLPQCNNVQTMSIDVFPRDCYWHVSVLHCVSHFHSATSYYLVFYFNWVAFVCLNKRYVMLCNYSQMVRAYVQRSVGKNAHVHALIHTHMHALIH